LLEHPVGVTKQLINSVIHCLDLETHGQFAVQLSTSDGGDE
jgi:hypothetical protein